MSDHYDLVQGGFDTLYNNNENTINLKYEYIGTMVAGPGKYSMLTSYCDSNGLDLEDMFIHAKNDVNYTLGQPKELDPKVTVLVLGWDPENDVNGDGHVDDTEFATRVNVLASAREKNVSSRIPYEIIFVDFFFKRIYYWGPPADYVLNIGNENYVNFIIDEYLPPLLTESVDTTPVGWNYYKSPFVSIPENQPHYCQIYVQNAVENENVIVLQYVTILPETQYTIVVDLSCEEMTDSNLLVYEYEFEGSVRIGDALTISQDTNGVEKKFYSFSTSNLTIQNGRVTIRFNGKNGKVTIEEVWLVQGVFDESNFGGGNGLENILLNPSFSEFEYLYHRYNGLFLDTMRITPAAQTGTEILEYPDYKNNDQYRTDALNLLRRLVEKFPDATIVGNGWRPELSEDFVIDGTEWENFARISTKITENTFQKIEDYKDYIQLVQFNQIYHPDANPLRPDLEEPGISFERDQIYGLALYYLVANDNTYFGYGVHGSYGIVLENWFNAIEFNVGKPLGEVFDINPVSEDHLINPNLLLNGDFELFEANWTFPSEDSYVFDEKEKMVGSRSIRIENQMGLNNINRQFVDLQAHTTYTLSFYMKTIDVNRSAEVYIYEFDDVTFPTEGSRSVNLLGTNDWKLFTIPFTVGEDTNGRINFRMYDSGGIAYFDGFHLMEGLYGNEKPVYAREYSKAIVILNQKGMEDFTFTYKKNEYLGKLESDGNVTRIQTSEIILREMEAVIMVKKVVGNKKTNVAALVVSLVLVGICIAVMLVAGLVVIFVVLYVLKKKNEKDEEEVELK